MSNRDPLPFEVTRRVRDTCLCLHLQRAARAVARRFDDALRPLGLTNGQFSLLMSLNRPEPPRKMPRNLRTNVDQIAQASGQAKSDGNEERSRAQKTGNQARRNGSNRRGNSRGTATAVANRTTMPTRIGRNDPCPCGSGKKYKKCHGA